MIGVFKDSFIITGILCYLNYPAYLKNACITCLEDIFDKMEETMEDYESQIYELEHYYKLIKDLNDRIAILNKINNAKKQLDDLKKQFKFIKNIT